MLFLAKRHLSFEAFALLLLLALTWIGWPRRNPPTIEVNMGALVRGSVAALAVGMGDLAIYATLQLIIGKQRTRGIIAGLRQQFQRSSLPVLIGGGILAGLGEEMLFRGVLQTRIGTIGSASTFAAAHVAGRSLLGPAIWALYDGLALGLIHRWSGNLVVPMLAHAMHDLAAGLAFKWGQL